MNLIVFQKREEEDEEIHYLNFSSNEEDNVFEDRIFSKQKLPDAKKQFTQHDNEIDYSCNLCKKVYTNLIYTITQWFKKKSVQNKNMLGSIFLKIIF